MLEGINFKTIFGSLSHVFWSSSMEQKIWCGAVLLYMLILAILHHKWKDDYSGKKITAWRVLCFMPLLACGVHYYLYLKGLPLDNIYNFVPLYAIAVLALLPIPAANANAGYKVTATLTGLLSVLCALYFAIFAPHLYNYSGKSYTESFRSLVKTMDKTYILKEWKGADFSALESKYMPMVEEAEQKHDPAMFADAVTLFCNSLHDGHVSFDYDYDDEKYHSSFQQRDYGFAMMKLDNGDAIAVCTSDKVQQKGIKDGTVITKWNGKPVLQAAAEDTVDMGFSAKTNADRLSYLYLSAMGKATADVTFLDEKGEEKTETLPNLSETKSYRAAYHIFAHEPEINNEKEWQEYIDSNFSTKMIDGKCGYLIVTEEETESFLHDQLGYINGDHKWAREMFREKLKDLKSKGMEYLVIDLRNNMGGNDEIGFALVDLLTKESKPGLNVGWRKNDGTYAPLSDHPIKGDGEFADLKVVALTNFNCASAGDSLAEALGKLPNVTLAGITDPCGCNQETGGKIVLTEGNFELYYPVGLVLNEKGDPNIDTKGDCISRNPVEVRIPFDLDAAMKMFRDKKDYELDWAVAYLEGN